MLDDRSYMKSSPLERRPVTVTLLIVLVAIYIVQSCLVFFGGYHLTEWFGLSLDGMKHFHFWQIITLHFVHQVSVPFHLFFTCFGLYLFWLALLLSGYGTIFPFSNYAHGAHLGGLLMGVAYIRWAAHQGRFGWHP